MTDANSFLISELIGEGLNRREARWLVEEFMVGGDAQAIGALRAAAQRRLDGEPLQYIIGHWPFRELDLDVDERVLIPRPETEGLVTIAMDELARADVAAPMIVDLGCGTGAIGLSLLYELAQRGIAATLVAVDVSSDALAVAKRNAIKHHLHAVSFVESSWFDGLDQSLQGRFDLVVANPPYVGERELAALDPVLGYEPLVALVAPDTDEGPGLAHLDVIIDGARTWLNDTGTLVCEHGDAQRAAVVDRARAAGFADVRDLDDLAGSPRVLVARS